MLYDFPHATLKPWEFKENLPICPEAKHLAYKSHQYRAFQTKAGLQRI